MVNYRGLFIAAVGALCVDGCTGGQPPIPTAGLQLWLKADAGVTLDGSTVSRWADQSGNGNDAIQMDAPRQPLFVKGGLNGKPTIHFDGFDDKLGLTGSKLMSKISFFIVFKIDSGEAGYDPVTFGDVDADGRVWGIDLRSRYTAYSADAINVYSGFNGAARAAAPRCASFGLWHNISVTTDGVMSSTTLRSNGVDALMTYDATNMFISVPMGNSTGTGIGGIAGNDAARPQVGGRNACRCDIVEVILYDIVLPDSLRRSVEHYLGTKYQIPPDSGVRK